MLSIDLKGKRAFVAGVADDDGYGWAIAKAMHQAGASVCVGTWPPVLTLFTKSLERKKFAESATYPGGELTFEKIYPLDAVYDLPEDVPPEIRDDKRYKELSGYTIQETAAKLYSDFGDKPLDIVIHSLANGPEVRKPLLETSRKGYLAAMSASAYSFVAMAQRFGPLLRPNGAFISLTYHRLGARYSRLRRRDEFRQGGAGIRHARAGVRGRAGNTATASMRSRQVRWPRAWRRPSARLTP